MHVTYYGHLKVINYHDFPSIQVGSEVGSGDDLDEGSDVSSDIEEGVGTRGGVLSLSGGDYLRDTMVFVKTMTEASISVMVSLDEPIEGVRLVIGGRRGVPMPSGYRLMFGGKQLEGGRSLRDYGVQRESTLFVVMSLRGGGKPMDFMSFVKGFDDWFVHQDRARVADAALDVRAMWALQGVSVSAVREWASGEGHDREEGDL